MAAVRDHNRTIGALGAVVAGVTDLQSRVDVEERPPPERPRPWQWLAASTLAASSLVGSVAVNILSDVVKQRLGRLTWVTIPLAVLAAASITVLIVREVRSRLARQRVAAEHGRPAPGLPAGVVNDLPPQLGVFGRADELIWIAETLETNRVVVLFGRAGVGTSACAIHAADLIRELGGPGPRYLDLCAGGRRLRPKRVLAAVAETLAQPVLLVLDNASPEQVRPLLRQMHQCRLLIAGGPALDELDGVTKRRLAEPTSAEAGALFLASAREVAPGGGPVTPRDPRTDETLVQLVALCGRQPPALRALAHRMAIRGWPAEKLLAMLRAQFAAGTWQPGYPNATLALLLLSDRAYAELSRGAQRLYRLLAVAPQPLSRNEIAVLGGVRRRRADRLLAELSAAAFVDSEPDDRYQIRPLLAGYARMHLQQEQPVRQRVAALRRLLRHLATAAERRAAMISTATRGTPGALDTNPHAWFARHEKPLMALVCRPWGTAGGLPPRPGRRLRRYWFRIAVALAGWYAAQRRLDDWASVCDAVLATPAARARAVAGWASNDLGVVRRLQGDPHAAANELNQAVSLRTRYGAAQAGTNLGLVLLDLDDADAIEQLQRARRQRSHRDRGGQALTELGLGAAYLRGRDPTAARHHLVVAANGFDALGDRRGYVAALINLALAQWWLGERLDAAHAWHRALEYCPDIDDPQLCAAAHLNAAAMLLAGPRPDPVRAREHAARSLRLGGSRRYGRGRALLYLGDAAALLRGPEAAKHRWRAAAIACQQAGDREGREAAEARLGGLPPA